MSTFKFKRGEYARDIITGFAGVIVARIDYLTGCNRYTLEPPLDKDGKLPEPAMFDENRLEYDPAHAGEKLDLDARHESPPG